MRKMSALFLFLAVGCRGREAREVSEESAVRAGAVTEDSGLTQAQADAIAARVETETLFVSPQGCDTCSGSATSPLRTLGAALRLAGSKRAAKAVDILLLDGTYLLAAPIVIDPSLIPSWGNRITVRALNPGRALLSAGIPLRGWKQSPLDNVATIALPEGASSQWIWSNPQGDLERPLVALERARTPNAPFGNGTSLPRIRQWVGGEQHQMRIAREASPLLPEKGGVSTPEQAVDIVLPLGWSMSRLPIASYLFDAAGEGISLTPRAVAGQREFSKPRGPAHVDGAQAFWLEGTLPDAPGEYAFDATQKAFLVFAPPSRLEHTVAASSVETLVKLQSVNNLAFDGIRFAHAVWKGGTEGFVGIASDTTLAGASGVLIPASVRVENARGIAFSACTFHDLGAAALHVSGSREVTVEHSRFFRIAGSGLRFEGSTNLKIHGNTFGRMGFTFGSDALSFSRSSDLAVSRNSFLGVGGRAAGISGKPFEVLAGRNTFFENLVDGALLAVSEGGAFHTHTGGVSFHENVVRNVPQGRWDTSPGRHAKAFAFDRGARGNVARRNLVEAVALFFHGNCQTENRVEQNLLRQVAATRIVTYEGCETEGDDQNPLVSDLLARFQTPECNRAGTCATTTSFEEAGDDVDAQAILSRAGAHAP